MATATGPLMHCLSYQESTMAKRTARPPNVIDIQPRLRERAAAEPTPPTGEPAVVVALAQHQDEETRGRLLFEQLWAEADAFFRGQLPGVVAR